MKRFLLAAALSFAASPLAALTCVPPSVEQAFYAADQAAEVYVPVVGVFSGFRQRPDAETINGANRRYTAGFTGRKITSRGRGAAFTVDVEITEQCLGSFCPIFVPDQKALTFLRRQGGTYSLQINACQGNYFTDPTPGQIETLRGCLRSRTCGPG